MHGKYKIILSNERSKMKNVLVSYANRKIRLTGRKVFKILSAKTEQQSIFDKFCFKHVSVLEGTSSTGIV